MFDGNWEEAPSVSASSKGISGEGLHPSPSFRRLTATSLKSIGRASWSREHHGATGRRDGSTSTRRAVALP